MIDFTNMLTDYNDVLVPEDIMKILKIGRNNVFRMLKEGTIQSVKIGKKYRIPKIYILQYLYENFDLEA